ncbi:hypothetical protein CEUSTIGMA_g650.t1 [Chlamydomonas eustigma]|uniref:PAS domain-containing protein n=1 Tax=Chlamydomonas eustigma TaxID=1157962 RepID=A0A250WQT2_9CHLO|nr:hypothetical protein CEUSTIGMA_g650.t1 [Chlamydomonas eustigma]|eukprot:GAX73197.1 hypothetical protein CEUSTIGMA_g650.t1 [Chlamydomonas eustigma]
MDSVLSLSRYLILACITIFFQCWLIFSPEVQICVTKLSGVGDDAVFLGLLRPIPFSKRDIRAWIAPNGIILACGPMFSALTGILADEMVGANVKSMIVDQEEFQKLLQEGAAASVADFDNSSLCRKVELINKYTEKIPCNVHLTLGGTDQNRMFVLHILRVEEVDDNLLVVNDEGSITFATIDLAVTLGYPLKSFLKLKLDQLLPPPINSMHEKFLIDAPPQYPVTSCRSGGVVNMVSSTNQQVPVRLKLSQREEQSGLKHIARITKCSPADFLDDRRMVIIATYDGLIESVETPKGSNSSPAIFGFPAAQLKGMSVCDVLDVFDDWRQRSGSTDMQLMMLALLDKDQEMPGAAWRVKIIPPEPSKGDQVVLLPAINARRRSSWAAANAGNQNRRPPKSAIMQASMIDTNLQGQAEGLLDDGKPRVKLVLWRRELLFGSIELDPLLRVKRADVSAGLLMGRPVSTLLKQPLCRFLSIPKNISWDQMMDVSKSRKSVLKSGSTVSKVTAIKAFEGHHPDGGSMRIQIQGVMISDAMSGKSKIEIVIRPDLTFTAAHSNIWGALGLDGFGTKDNNVTQESPGGDAHDSDGGKGSDREGGNQNDEDNNSDLSFNRDRGLQASLGGLSGKEETEERPSGGLVTNWMRTLSQQRRDAVLGMTDPDAPASPLRSPGKSRLAMDGPPSLRRGSLNVRTTGSPSGRRRSMDNPFGPDSGMSLDEGGPDKDMDWEKLAESMPDEAMSIPVKRHHHHHGAHQEAHGGGQKLVGEGGGDDNASEDSMSEASSANGEGSVASSAVTGEAVEEILVDSRRGKVLRKLLALLQSKEMNTPISRLKIFTIVVISLFVAIRVICFAVLVTMLNTETRRLTELQDYSMASDRAQIVDSYVETIAFCKGLPNGTAPETICEDVVSLSAAANALLSNILDLEKGHQDSYLGVTGKPARPTDPNTYNVWSNTVNNVSLYLDTKPPLVVYEQRGMWELGNLYIAAARDAIYMTQYNTSTQMYSSRPRNFLLLNAPSSILWGYANLIDNFMVYVWNQLGGLEKANIALLVIESIAVIPLLCAWQWYLISKAERVRLVQWMLMVALPTPVLHTLSSRPVKIAEDSDDESDDENSEAEVETVGAPPDNKKAMPGSQVMTPAGGKSQGPRSSLDPSGVGNRRSSLDVAGTGTRRGSVDFSGGPKRTSLDVAGTGTRRGSMDFSGGPKRTSLDLAAGGGPGGKRRLSADLGGLQGDGDLSQGLQQIDEEGEGYEGSQVVAVKRGPKKMVAPSYKFTFIFVIPLVLWGIVVLVIYSLSQATIDGLKAPVAALNMLMHVIYRFSNMRLITLLMVTAGSDVSKNYWKAELVQSITNMTSEYNALMYGGNSVTQTNQMFQQPSPASTFVSASFSDLFFVDNECFRFNQSSCYTVNSTWYEATHHGLNSMMIRVLDELTLLTQDANPNITYTNPRFVAWYSIGVTDLYDGLQTSSQIFVNYGMTKYKGVQLMQIVLLIVCIVLAAMYLYWVLRPYLALQSDEVIKVAGLVSHVPHEVDARSHAKKVLRLMSAAPKKSKVQPGPNA